MIHLSVGSTVKVRGIRGSVKEDWFGIITDNRIRVLEPVQCPFVQRSVWIAADQVVEQSNGWEIGSQLVLQNGQTVILGRVPKISLDWLKKTRVRKFYRPKVELAAIRSIDKAPDQFAAPTPNDHSRLVQDFDRSEPCPES